jgi:hypothetical protein
MLTRESALTRLAASADVVAALGRSVSDAQARWKPTPEEWSVLEVLGHLHDEEREDFRRRVDYILHRPDEAWPPIDPAGWVRERNYNERLWEPALDAFVRERQASLRWLEALPNPDWSASHRHPRLGLVSAGDMLAAWVAHDHLHIRQLNQLHWQYLATTVPPCSLTYAGGW